MVKKLQAMTVLLVPAILWLADPAAAAILNGG